MADRQPHGGKALKKVRKPKMSGEKPKVLRKTGLRGREGKMNFALSDLEKRADLGPYMAAASKPLH